MSGTHPLNVQINSDLFKTASCYFPSIISFPSSILTFTLSIFLKNLVECLTPGRRKKKYYGITGSGKEVLKDIRDKLSNSELEIEKNSEV